MQPSALARSLEPLVAILWGIFLVWSAWLGAVWVLGINEQWLGLSVSASPLGGWEAGAAAFVEGGARPSHEALRRAVLVMAEFADVTWLALATVNLHLVITTTNGLGTARAWLGFTAGGAFVLGLLNHFTGLPFGWMAFGRALGSQVAGVAAGWLLLWAVLVMSAREAVLRVSPRASHAAVALATAVLVLLAAVNLEPIAHHARAWWLWHDGDVRHPLAMRWWTWLSWFACAWLIAFAMREKDVVSGAARRSVRPLIIFVLLNGIALAANARGWLAR